MINIKFVTTYILFIICDKFLIYHNNFIKSDIVYMSKIIIY